MTKAICGKHGGFTFRILVGTVGRGVVVLVGRRGVLPWNMIRTRVTMLHPFLFYFHERFFQLKNTSLLRCVGLPSYEQVLWQQKGQRQQQQ